MKETIKETEIKKLRQCSIVFTVFLIATIVSAVPFATWIGIYAIIPWGVLIGMTIFFAYRAERIIKRIIKDNNIHTYKKIMAFMDGKRLDEIEQQQEIGKRQYQGFLLALGSGLITLIICLTECKICRMRIY